MCTLIEAIGDGKWELAALSLIMGMVRVKLGDPEVWREYGKEKEE